MKNTDELKERSRRQCVPSHVTRREQDGGVLRRL